MAHAPLNDPNPESLLFMSENLVDITALFAFAFAAIGLLGSPGPAIAALLAVGKVSGFRSGLQFYGGLQVGLGTAAALSAAGFVGIVTALPALKIAMTVVACVYLLYLAYKIATAPMADEANDTDNAPTGGFALAGAAVGITNPKAYIAFAALMSPVTLVVEHAPADALVKWAVVVLVMIVVDFAWLLAGVALGTSRLPPRAERGLNWLLAAMIVLAGTALL